MATRRKVTLVLTAAAGLTAGWLLRGPSIPSVLAHDSSGSLAFQLSGIARETSLTVYNGDTHTLYVYPAVTQGNATVNCEFMLQLSRVGGTVQRKNCEPGSLLPSR